jgi:cysteine desulfurase/selenocysteine lyase
MQSFQDQLSEKTKLVAVTMMSNVLGSVTDLKSIASKVQAVDALVVVDACQGAVHLDIDVQDLGVDFLAISGHKIYGPTGVGALYGKLDQLNQMRPFLGGGEMIDKVTRDAVSYNVAPHRFEAGTPQILEVIALGAAIDWFNAHNSPEAQLHKKEVYQRLIDNTSGVNGITIHGTQAAKGPIMTFSLEGVHPHDLAQIMDRYGVAIRAGHHCAQPLMDHLGVSATARASVGIYNTMEEADIFAESLEKARKMLLA